MIFTQFMDLKPWALLMSTMRRDPGQPHGVNRSRDREQNHPAASPSRRNMEITEVDPAAQSVILDLNGHVAENSGRQHLLAFPGVLSAEHGQLPCAGVSHRHCARTGQKLGIETQETVLQPTISRPPTRCFFT